MKDSADARRPNPRAVPNPILRLGPFARRADGPVRGGAGQA
jgi:hypothetical protein